MWTPHGADGCVAGGPPLGAPAYAEHCHGGQDQRPLLRSQGESISRIVTKFSCVQQCFGSLFIWSGSGSSILGWIPIRIQSEFSVLWPKIGKNLQLNKIKLFLDQKLQFTCPSYRRSLQPAKGTSNDPALQNMKFLNFFPTFVVHFCPPGSGFG